MMQNTTRTAALTLVLLAAVPAVEARHFKVYGYGTRAQGEFELVYWTDYINKSDNNMSFYGKSVKREGLVGHTLELEYGVTNRLTLAGYIDYEQPSGENLRYVQSRVVAARYRFGDRQPDAFNSAIYLEYYMPDKDYLRPGQANGKEKLELRLIFERKFDDFTLRLNPKFEKVVSGGDVNEGLEFEYGVSLYQSVSSNFSWGLEAYGGIGELTDPKPADAQKHYLVPAVSYKFSKQMKWNLGYGVGLTDAADDATVKSIIEWKF